MNPFLQAYFPEQRGPRPGGVRQHHAQETDDEPVHIPADIRERQASHWLIRCAKPSISGQGGDRALFGALCMLVHGFGLAPEQAAALVYGHPYNRVHVHAGRPGFVGTNERWTLGDLRRKATASVGYPPADGAPRGSRVCRTPGSRLVRIAQ